MEEDEEGEYHPKNSVQVLWRWWCNVVLCMLFNDEIDPWFGVDEDVVDTAVVVDMRCEVKAIMFVVIGSNGS